jgi:pullulanase
MTSQGIPFFQAGEEMLRSKPLPEGGFDHNSYSSPDSVNSLKWENMNDPVYQDVYNYYAGLIAFRQAHPALRMTSAEEVAQHITQIGDLDGNVLAFHITSGANGENNDLFVIFNPRPETTNVPLPEGEWTVYINGEDAGTTALGTASGSVTVDAISAMVLAKPGTPAAPEEPEATEPAATEPADTTEPTGNYGWIIAIVAAVVCAGAAVAVVISKKRKK